MSIDTASPQDNTTGELPHQSNKDQSTIGRAQQSSGSPANKNREPEKHTTTMKYVRSSCFQRLFACVPMQTAGSQVKQRAGEMREVEIDRVLTETKGIGTGFKGFFEKNWALNSLSIAGVYQFQHSKG